MKTWLKASVLFLAASGFVACSHHAGESSANQGYGHQEETAVAVDNSCAELSQIICTREYQPTRCVLGQEEFSSSNPCEARKLAKAYACEKKVPYIDEEVKCETKSIVKAEEPADECATEANRKPCTREYKPQVCRLGKVVAKGNNHCEALNSLRTNVCSKKITFSTNRAVCEAANVNENALPKAKRSR